jgi:hypothetical protein
MGVVDDISFLSYLQAEILGVVSIPLDSRRHEITSVFDGLNLCHLFNFLQNNNELTMDPFIHHKVATGQRLTFTIRSLLDAS